MQQRRRPAQAGRLERSCDQQWQPKPPSRQQQPRGPDSRRLGVPLPGRWPVGHLPRRYRAERQACVIRSWRSRHIHPAPAPAHSAHAQRSGKTAAPPPHQTAKPGARYRYIPAGPPALRKARSAPTQSGAAKYPGPAKRRYKTANGKPFHRPPPSGPHHPYWPAHPAGAPGRTGRAPPACPAPNPRSQCQRRKQSPGRSAIAHHASNRARPGPAGARPAVRRQHPPAPGYFPGGRRYAPAASASD